MTFCLFCMQSAAARYYRLAEKAGNKTLGNSWYVPWKTSRGPTTFAVLILTSCRIWKEKYDAPGKSGGKK